MRFAINLSVIALVVLFAVDPVLAEEVGSSSSDLGKFGAMIGIGIAVLGGAFGQGRAASAALEGISRNPGAAGQMFIPLILGLALIESLVLFAFLVTGGFVGK